VRILLALFLHRKFGTLCCKSQPTERLASHLPTAFYHFNISVNQHEEQSFSPTFYIFVVNPVSVIALSGLVQASGAQRL
jgi:hypothetical protein